jgi:hypothetical protein
MACAALSGRLICDLIAPAPFTGSAVRAIIPMSGGCNPR